MKNNNSWRQSFEHGNRSLQVRYYFFALEKHLLFFMVTWCLGMFQKMRPKLYIVSQSALAVFTKNGHNSCTNAEVSLQSLLRGRFLRNKRFVQEETSPSLAANELGLLRQRHTVSGLRY